MVAPGDDASGEPPPVLKHVHTLHLSAYPPPNYPPSLLKLFPNCRRAILGDSCNVGMDVVLPPAHVVAEFGASLESLGLVGPAASKVVPCLHHCTSLRELRISFGGDIMRSALLATLRGLPRLDTAQLCLRVHPPPTHGVDPHTTDFEEEFAAELAKEGRRPPPDITLCF